MHQGSKRTGAANTVLDGLILFTMGQSLGANQAATGEGCRICRNPARIDADAFHSGGFGARRWVCLQVTATVAPASCKGKAVCNANTGAATHLSAGFSQLFNSKERHPGHVRVLQNGHSNRFWKTQRSRPRSATALHRQMPDTRFTRKSTAVDSNCSAGIDLKVPFDVTGNYNEFTATAIKPSGLFGRRLLLKRPFLCIPNLPQKTRL